GEDGGDEDEVHELVVDGGGAEDRARGAAAADEERDAAEGRHARDRAQGEGGDVVLVVGDAYGVGP
ncbi:hypothetical protein ADL26_15350, partial [Thermoactinomyces vulgaris]